MKATRKIADLVGLDFWFSNRFLADKIHVLATFLHVAPAGTPTLVMFHPPLHHSAMKTPICSRVLVSFSVPVFISPFSSIRPDPGDWPWLLGVVVGPSQPVTLVLSRAFSRKFAHEAVLFLAVYGCQACLEVKSQSQSLALPLASALISSWS